MSWSILENPSINLLLHLSVRITGACAHLPQSMGERRVTTYVANPLQGKTETYSDVQILLHLRAVADMFFNCGRKLEVLERTHPCTEKACEIHEERPLVKPMTFLLQENSATNYFISYIILHLFWGVLRCIYRIKNGHKRKNILRLSWMANNFCLFQNKSLWFDAND